MQTKLFFILVLCGFTRLSISQDLSRYEMQHPQMGTTFRVIVYAQDATKAHQAMEMAKFEIDRLNALFSHYIPTSEVSILSSGLAISISNELQELILFSKLIHEITNHFFDISIGALNKRWRRAIFEQDLPGIEETDTLLNYSGMQFIRLDTLNNLAQINKKGLSIDLSGIAKGYTVDKIFEMLQRRGFNICLVEGGGDIRIGDAPPGKIGWNILIQESNESYQLQEKVIPLSNISIATSGNSYHYIESERKKFQHHINPFNGSAQYNVTNVTIMAERCWLADALSTALSAAGSAFVSQIEQNLQNSDRPTLRNVKGWLIENRNLTYSTYHLNPTP